MKLLNIAALIYAVAYAADVIYTIKSDKKEDDAANIPEGELGDFFI